MLQLCVFQGMTTLKVNTVRIHLFRDPSGMYPVFQYRDRHQPPDDTARIRNEDNEIYGWMDIYSRSSKITVKEVRGMKKNPQPNISF